VANPNNPFSNIGLVAKFTAAFAKAGGTPEILNSFSENKRRMRELVALANPYSRRIAKQLCCSMYNYSLEVDLSKIFTEDDWVPFSRIGESFLQLLPNTTECVKVDFSVSYWELLTGVSDWEFAQEVDFRRLLTIEKIWIALSNARGDPDDFRSKTLNVDGTKNVFYIRDRQGKKWSVIAVWTQNGWDIQASQYNTKFWDPGTVIVTSTGR
tara:strand:+ start:72487 stop:73119 length:633 start_codon:yes stop_codon:yes gene_type:complete